MAESKYDLVVKCPVCRAPKVQHAAPHFFHEYLAMLCLCTPYRCRHCFARFLRPFFWNMLAGGGHSQPHKPSGSRENIRAHREKHSKPSGQ